MRIKNFLAPLFALSLALQPAALFAQESDSSQSNYQQNSGLIEEKTETIINADIPETEGDTTEDTLSETDSPEDSPAAVEDGEPADISSEENGEDLTVLPETEDPEEETEDELPGIISDWNAAGTTYYGEDGEPVTGKNEIDGKTYFFDTDGRMMYGFIGNEFYHYNDGSQAFGPILVDQSEYYLDSDGQLVRNREITVNGISYYYGSDGRKVLGFQSLPGSYNYYSWMDGSKESGLKVYDDVLYPLGDYTFIQPGLKVINGNEYYQKENGTLARLESIEIDGKTYYFNADGIRQVSGPVETPQGTIYLDQYGNPISYNQYMIKQECEKVFEQVGRDLASVFNWTVYSITYAHAGGAGPEADALQGFLNRSGNCYVFASTFAYLASELGYAARVVYGSVLYTNGTVGGHGWVMINEGGREYIYDPEGQYELGGNFFRQDPNYPMIRYMF